MIVNMSEKATEEQINHIIDRIREAGYNPHVTRGTERTIVAAVGSGRRHEIEALQVAPGVDNVVAIAQPFKLVSKQVHPERTIVRIDGVQIGGPEVVVIAGPCSVESREQLFNTAHAVKRAEASMLRGGAYKPRTSPYDFQGLGIEALKILSEAKKETGLPIVTEVMSTEDIDIISEHADMLQVGARNMQNYHLLQAVGEVRKPVLLRRGPSATISRTPAISVASTNSGTSTSRWRRPTRRSSPRSAPRCGGSNRAPTAAAWSTAGRSIRSGSSRCRGRRTASSTRRSSKRAPTSAPPRCNQPVEPGAF